MTQTLCRLKEPSRWNLELQVGKIDDGAELRRFCGLSPIQTATAFLASLRARTLLFTASSVACLLSFQCALRASLSRPCFLPVARFRGLLCQCDLNERAEETLAERCGNMALLLKLRGETTRTVIATVPGQVSRWNTWDPFAAILEAEEEKAF